MSAPSPSFGPIALTLAALVVVAALWPPETSGSSLAGCAGLIALAATWAATRGQPPRGGVVLISVVATLALLALLADSPAAAVEPSAIALLAAVAGWTAASAPGPSLRAWLAPSFAGCGALVGAKALYEASFGLDRMAQRVREAADVLPDAATIAGRLEQGRAYAGFPTPAAAGGFLVLASCITAGYALSRTGRARWVLWGAVAVQCAGLAATRSLTAAASLAAALAVGAVVGRSRRAGIAAALALCAIAPIAALRAGQVLSVGSDDNPWRLRAGNVRAGAAMAAEHPWFGVGPGNFAEAYPRHRRPGDNESRHAHCLPVELVAELGVPAGLAAGTAILALFLFPLVGTRGQGDRIARGAAYGLAAFALQNLADFTAYLPSVAVMASVVRGALARPSSAPSTAVGRTALGAVAFVAVGIAVGAGRGASARAEARLAALRGDSGAAVEASVRAARWAPWSADAALLEAQTRRETASASADRAVALAPTRPVAREVRGRLRAAEGDIPGAYADLLQASRLHGLRSDYARLAAEAASQLPHALDPGPR